MFPVCSICHAGAQENCNYVAGQEQEGTMPVEVSEVEKLREYLRGVLGAAQHHAHNVDEIILAIAGAVIARKDDSPLQVRAGRSKEMGRALSFTSARGKTY